MKLRHRLLPILITIGCLTMLSPIGDAGGQTTVLTGTVPLVLSNIAASGVTFNSAVVSWATNGEATSQVFYDTTAHDDIERYRLSTAQGTDATRTHSVALNHLQPGTVYHFRVRSTVDNWTALSQDLTFATSAPGGGGGAPGGGGGAGVPQGPGVINLAPYINNDGVFNIPAVIRSADGRVELAFDKNARGVTSQGNPVRFVSIREFKYPPSPPMDMQIAGPVYEIGPDGASFAPSPLLTIKYDPGSLPGGLNASRLVLAEWDTGAAAWRELSSSVNENSLKVSARIARLGTYAILFPAFPATFVAEDLTVSPAYTGPHGSVRVAVALHNRGDFEGRYVATLKVNGAVERTTNLVIEGGRRQIVSWTVTRSAPGRYTVEVDGLIGVFDVTAGTIASAVKFSASALQLSHDVVDAGQDLVITVTVANPGQQNASYPVGLFVDGVATASEEVTLAPGENRTLSFQVSSDAAGVHMVEVEGLSGTFEVRPAPAPRPSTRAFNRWVFAGIVAVAAATLGLSWSRARRRSK